MAERRPEDGVAVAAAAGRAGQVDDERATEDAGGAAREEPVRRLRDRVRPERLGDPRRLALEHGARRLGRHVARREPRAAGRQHERRRRRRAPRSRRRSRRPRPARRAARRRSRPPRSSSARVSPLASVRLPARHAVGHRQDGRVHLLRLLDQRDLERHLLVDRLRHVVDRERRHRRRRERLHLDARSAQSSRPTRRSRPASPTIRSSTPTCDSGSGWQSGISSAVRFAAMIPASCAVVSASPFGSSPSRAAVSGAIRTTRARDGATALHRLVRRRRPSGLALPRRRARGLSMARR